MNIINYKALIGLVIVLCFFGKPIHTMSQNADMQRDLDVIEAVITEIVNSEFGGNTRLSSKRANASYVEGRGILIKIPSLNANSYAFGSNVIKIVTDGDDEERLVYNATSSSAPKSDEGKKEGEEALLVKLEKVMRTFLVNYGDLARDLPENEKIILLFKKHKTSSWSYKIGSGNATSIGYTNSSEEDDTLHQLSAEVLKSDISKLKAGKLNEDEFWQKVSIKKVSAKGSEKDKLEYNVLAKIFEGRLSQKGKEIKEQDDNVIIIGVSDWHKVDYEVVTGLGVVYNINVNMPFKSNIFIKGIINDKNKKEKLEELAEKAEEADEDRDEKLEDLINDLIVNIQEDMVAYGRTLRSLPQDEMLIVEIHLPRCYDCDLPSTYQLSLSKSVLEDYEKRKIDLEKAMEKIIVKEIGKAKDKNSYDGFYFDWRE